jgi:opacity protein-like surface antigen
MERIETMKKLLLSLAAVAALGAAAAPAAAQPYGDWGHYDHGNEGRSYGRLNTAYVDSLEWKITAAAREGRISWGEARGLKYELREVQPLAWRVETGAARGWEVERLQRTVRHIEYAVNRAPRYGRYDGGYGWR